MYIAFDGNSLFTAIIIVQLIRLFNNVGYQFVELCRINGALAGREQTLDPLGGKRLDGNLPLNLLRDVMCRNGHVSGGEGLYVNHPNLRIAIQEIVFPPAQVRRGIT